MVCSLQGPSSTKALRGVSPVAGLSQPPRLCVATAKTPSPGQGLSLPNWCLVPGLLAKELCRLKPHSAVWLLPLAASAEATRKPSAICNCPSGSFRLMLNPPYTSPQPGEPSPASAGSACRLHASCPLLPYSCLLAPSSFSASLTSGCPAEGIMSLNVPLLAWPSIWFASPTMRNKAWFCTGLRTLWNHTPISSHTSLPARHGSWGGVFFQDP